MSGFSAKMFEEKVDEKYKCPICLYILQDPMQTPICGHIFCRSCIATSIRKFDAVCPIDNSSLTDSQLWADKAVKREISLLKVKCPNEGYGCGWKGTLGQFESQHRNRCPFFPANCGTQSNQASPVEHQE